MQAKRQLILKKNDSIIYQVKADDDIIWEGPNIDEVFPRLKADNKKKRLSIVWRTETGVTDVQ
jgi:hypothetical protein